MRAIAAHFGSCENDLKSEMRFNLLAKALQRFAEKFLHFTAAEADHVRMFLLAPRLVIMLLSRLVHQIQLIDQPAFLQQLQCAVDGDAIQFRIFLFRHLIQPLGVEMLPGLIDEVEQNLPLARQTHRVLGRNVFG